MKKYRELPFIAGRYMSAWNVRESMKPVFSIELTKAFDEKQKVSRLAVHVRVRLIRSLTVSAG